MRKFAACVLLVACAAVVAEAARRSQHLEESFTSKLDQIKKTLDDAQFDKADLEFFNGLLIPHRALNSQYPGLYPPSYGPSYPPSYGDHHGDDHNASQAVDGDRKMWDGKDGGDEWKSPSEVDELAEEA